MHKYGIILWAVMGVMGVMGGCATAPERSTTAPESTSASERASVVTENAPAKGQKVAIQITEQTRDVSEPGCQIKARYFHYGIPTVDQEIDAFVTSQLKEARDSLLKEHEADKAEFGAEREIPDYYFMLEAESVRANEEGIDILFSLTNYRGGAHDGLALHTLMFDPQTGKRVDFFDRVQNPEVALDVLSVECGKKVREMIEEDMDVESMIVDGTAPKRENFANILRTDEGFRVYFEPYQVAPWAVGTLVVDLPWSVLDGV